MTCVQVFYEIRGAHHQGRDPGVCIVTPGVPIQLSKSEATLAYAANAGSMVGFPAIGREPRGR